MVVNSQEDGEPGKDQEDEYRADEDEMVDEDDSGKDRNRNSKKN